MQNKNDHGAELAAGGNDTTVATPERQDSRSNLEIIADTLDRLIEAHYMRGTIMYPAYTSLRSYAGGIRELGRSQVTPFSENSNPPVSEASGSVPSEAQK